MWLELRTLSYGSSLEVSHHFSVQVMSALTCLSSEQVHGSLMVEHHCGWVPQWQKPSPLKARVVLANWYHPTGIWERGGREEGAESCGCLNSQTRRYQTSIAEVHWNAWLVQICVRKLVFQLNSLSSLLHFILWLTSGIWTNPSLGPSGGPSVVSIYSSLCQKMYRPLKNN